MSDEDNEFANMAAQMNTLRDEASEAPAAPVEEGGLNMEADIDVPTPSFWDNDGESEAVEESVQEPTLDNVPDESQIVKFNVNGKEQELSMADVKKQLSLQGGQKDAFNRASKAEKRLKELEAKQAGLQENNDLMAKLESLKNDPMAIIKIATGQDPEDFLNKIFQDRQIRENGSASEIDALDKSEKIARMERQLEEQAERQNLIEKNELSRLRTAETAELKALVDGEFYKHQFKLADDVDSNVANDMLYSRGRKRMTEYVKKYQSHPNFKNLLPKMAQKSFEDVAGEINRLTTGQVQDNVDKAIADKKAKAAERAQMTSTSRMSEPNKDSFKGMSIRDIANKLTGTKNFSN